jgi:hypothetical protein
MRHERIVGEPCRERDNNGREAVAQWALGSGSLRLEEAAFISPY